MLQAAPTVSGSENNMATRPLRILLTGKDGQLGFALQSALVNLGSVTAVGRSECDLTQPSDLLGLLDQVKPDIIVNPAAYTAVDQAETYPDMAYAVNAIAPRIMAEYAQANDALLVHYSTDYVFDGRSTEAYKEDSVHAPLSVYGQSKSAGEEAIRLSGCRHLIIRTSWVFGTHGGNFLKTILRLASERDALRIVSDQYGAPTSTALLAQSTIELLSRLFDGENRPVLNELLGTYHVAAAGRTTWYEYARFVIAEAWKMDFRLRASQEKVSPIATEEYPLPAPRPRNSVLDTSKFSQVVGAELPNWQGGVIEVLEKLKENEHA